MKKFLLSLAAAALCSSASLAGTITIDPTELAKLNSSSSYVTDGFTGEIGGAGFYFNQVNPKTGQIRANNTNASAFSMYNTSSIGGLQSVTMTVTLSGTNPSVGTWNMALGNTEAIDANATATDLAGVVSEDGTVVTFTVPSGTDASYFHMNLTTKGAGTVNLISLVIEYTGELGTPDTGGDDDNANVTETWSGSAGGFTTGTSSNAPTEPTNQTSTATGITYTFFQTVVNTSNYLFIKGGQSAGYISWSLDFDCAALELLTTNGNSTGTDNFITVYADGNVISSPEQLLVNGQNATYTITIPEQYQKAGTVYKILASGSKNVQFVSFTYVKAGNESENPGGGDEPGTTEKETTIYSGLALADSPSEGWTINDTTLSEGVTFVWSWENQYGYKGTAFVSGVSYAAESMLVSPEIDLTGASQVKLAFRQALNYLNGNTITDFCHVLVKETTDSQWTELTIDNWPAGSSWSFVNSTADLSAFDGKTIQIAFNYTSTSACAPTWEINSVVVKGMKEVSGDEPGDDDSVTIVWADQGYENDEALETFTQDGITYSFSAGTNSNGPKYYNTGTAIRLYGGNSMTVAVEEGQLIKQIDFTVGSSNPFNAASTANVGTFNTTDAVWTSELGAQSVTFTMGGSSGHVRIEKMVIYLIEGTGGETPVEPEPAEELTVAEALEIISEGTYGTTVYQVTGIITEITDMANTDSGYTYGNATYIIKDAETDEEGLTIFRGYWLDGAKFTTGDEIAVGGTVTVEGTLTLYEKDDVKTPEMNSGNKIIRYTAPEGGDQPGPDQPGEDSESVTFNFTEPSSLDSDFSDEGEDKDEVELTGMSFTSDEVTISFAASEGATTQPKLYYSGSASNPGWAFRFYKDTEFTITAATGYHITKIEFTGTNVGKDWTMTDGSITNNTWTPSTGTLAANVVFGKSVSGNNPVIKGITVYYAEGEGVFTGIDAVEAADGEAIYFNLQGVRVQNPDRGIFVKVQNGKATKVLF